MDFLVTKAVWCTSLPCCLLPSTFAETKYFLCVALRPLAAFEKALISQVGSSASSIQGNFFVKQL